MNDRAGLRALMGALLLLVLGSVLGCAPMAPDHDDWTDHAKQSLSDASDVSGLLADEAPDHALE